MKNILLTIAFIAISLVIPADAGAQNVSETSAVLAVESKESKTDALDVRVQALEKVFENYNSPLRGQGIHYVKYADEYNIDWRLLAAISGLESGFGRALMPGSHNAYGWGGGHIYFESWEEGIKVISKALSERYYGRGATTVWTIGPIYAESPTWAVRVNGFMNTIEKEYKLLSVFSFAPTI